MPALLPFLVVFVAGIGLAVQPAANASLAKVSGSVVLAALVSFGVGTALLFATWLLVDRGNPPALRSAPWWGWFGGVCGAVYVVAFAYAPPRIGLAIALTIAIAGQLIMALVLDHFDLLGLKVSPMTWTKAAGAALVLAGVVLVRRG